MSPPLLYDDTCSIRHFQVFLDFGRRSDVVLDGPAKNRPRLVESTRFTGSLTLNEFRIGH
jgi:hypothetical protein